MKNYLLALAISLCALPMPSEAGIFSRFVRVGSVLNDRIKPLFGPVYITSLLTSIGFMVARNSRKQTEERRAEWFDKKLLHVRNYMRILARADASASNFEGDPSFAHYRAAIAIFGNTLCAGAYASRCDKFKKELSQELHQPITQEELAHKIAVNSKDLGSFDAQCDKNALSSPFPSELKRELYLANPKVSITAYRRGYNNPNPFYNEKSRLQEYIDLNNNYKDAEKDVAAAEARMAAKKK